MKTLFPLIIFAALSTTAHAHPGGSQLVCKSAKNSGSNQKIELSLRRANGAGWAAPSIDIKVANQKFQLTTPDENNLYGSTFHNSPLKVITVTAFVPSEVGANTGDLSVVAIPETVKAFDYDNNPVKWDLNSEKDECNDSHGRATFQGIIHGLFQVNEKDIQVETQILDCELSYSPGMAC